MAKKKPPKVAVTQKFITISDVHHGAKDHESMHNELYAEEGFFETVDALFEDPESIGVAVLGDWFDKKLDANDPRARLGVSSMLDLFNRCMQAGKQLIVLRGTYSHDLNQMDLFRELEVIYPGFKLVNHVTVMDFGGLKTLIIPEEYPADPDEFYAEYYADTYDLILGHGFFDFNCFDANDAEKSIPRMPIFEADRIVEMSPLTIFGHDHTHKNYEGRIWYGGSFSRLCHGEENPKGFLYVEYSEGDFEVHQVTNDQAPKYITVSLDTLCRKTSEITFGNLAQIIERAKVRYSADDLKVKISSEFTSKYRTEVELLKNHFANKPGYRFETGRLSVEKTGKNVVQDEVQDESERDTTYDFLFEPGNVVDKVENYIRVKYGEERALTRDQVAATLAPT